MQCASASAGGVNAKSPKARSSAACPCDYHVYRERMTTVAITLNEDHEKFIRDAVDGGSFTTKSEVVATALDILKTREELRKARRAELKREIEKGIAELDAGKTAEFDLESFLADMNAKRTSLQS